MPPKGLFRRISSACLAGQHEVRLTIEAIMRQLAQPLLKRGSQRSTMKIIADSNLRVRYGRWVETRSKRAFRSGGGGSRSSDRQPSRDLRNDLGPRAALWPLQARDCRGGARLCGVEKVVLDRPALDAGLATMEAGADFADGVIAYEGRWLGGETFVSFDKKAVAAISKQGQQARLLA